MNKIQLKIAFDDGMVNGKQKYKNKTYSKFKENATDDALRGIVSEFGSLSRKSILKSYKILTVELA